MNHTLDDSQYEIKDSWWNPRFLEQSIEKEFRIRSDSAALSAVRAGLGIIIFFWWGFRWWRMTVNIFSGSPKKK